MAVQPPNRTIILVGMMGAGKSTIGKALAALMGTKFVDLDRELEERCGVSIPHIFETEGEAGFTFRLENVRNRDSAALFQLSVEIDEFRPH